MTLVTLCSLVHGRTFLTSTMTKFFECAMAMFRRAHKRAFLSYIYDLKNEFSILVNGLEWGSRIRCPRGVVTI